MIQRKRNSFLKWIVVIAISIACLEGFDFIVELFFPEEVEVLGLGISNTLIARLSAVTVVVFVVFPYFFPRDKNK